MNTATHRIGNLPTKLVAGAVAVLCLAAGIVGLVLPIIPGLLLLVLAAVIVARNFPSMSGVLRRNPTMRKHLDGADSFLDLTVWQKVRLSGWIGAKLVIDSMAVIAASVAKAFDFVANKLQR